MSYKEEQKELYQEFFEDSNLDKEKVGDFLEMTIDNIDSVIDSLLEKEDTYQAVKCDNCDCLYISNTGYGDCIYPDGSKFQESYVPEGAFKEGSYVCECCVDYDSDKAVNIACYDSNGVTTGFIGDYSLYLDEMSDYDEAKGLILSRSWKSTDGWRGYELLEFNPDFVAIDEGWNCPFDNAGSLDAKQWESFLKEHDFEDDEKVYVVVSRTSNCLTCCIDILVHKDIKDKIQGAFESYLKKVA